MKKIWPILISLVVIGLLIVIYQQHQLVREYRSLIYADMTQLNVPIFEILEFHESTEDYDGEEIRAHLSQLNARFADFFNYSGGALHVESGIEEEYFDTYNDTKLAYNSIIQRYIDSSTPEEREQVIEELKESYGQYKEFLETAKEELDMPI